MSPRRRGRDRRYVLVYAMSAQAHLKALSARERATVVDAVEERLSFEPARETRNRKQMAPNSLDAGFELRLGSLRVYYDVDESERVVSVLAVGVKDRNRVLIGGEEVVL